MNPLLLVGFGGMAGALGRHLVGARLERNRADTLVVNVCGSVLLGALVVVPITDSVALALGTGFCGAFTTFSSFAFETVRLAELGHEREAVLYAGGTLAVALAGVAVGGFVGAAL
ncbi:CrcB family protein [Halomicroarcula limicola]|uniref:Fluoride-specific ion channel FluC n=1 Tax=Haloarcula limicola TaxID=1429915 RepID=A0A8J7Y9R6_9EURY|nr:CrcB family protein [Halomicroarcula limicola]MBV0924324.1 CrcB family protein [Halomicroarcula limicola]